MSKWLFGIVIAILLLGGFYLRGIKTSPKESANAPADYKSAKFLIEGQPVKLENGFNATEAVPGSKITTRFFGNEVIADLNGDGREDAAFILTQDRGGSATFFYAVAALNTDHGYVGSDGYLLGDRIAPQSTNLSPNTRHKYVVVFNYADRALGEPMTVRPSLGKSVFLKLNPATMQWGIVEPDFEGEAR